MEDVGVGAHDLLVQRLETHPAVDVLADPGTYCYHGEPAWRQWFRSTAAHNTLEVAGTDQSEPGGPFMWASHAAARVLESRTGGRLQSWTAEHDGYRRPPVPATHRRAVSLDAHTRTLTVADTLHTFTDVPVRLSWHLGPDVAEALVANHGWTYAIVTEAAAAGHAGFADHWRTVGPEAWRARRWCQRHRRALLTAAG